MSYRLLRTWYKTDVIEDEPEYVGTASVSIPDSALRQGSIVGVDWSKRGEVEVTFLIKES